jgi:hypothetical protein
MNMKMNNAEKATVSAAATLTPLKVFTSGYDIGSEIAGVNVSAQITAARLRTTLEKAKVIEAGADFPEWKAAESLFQLAKNDGRIKFDRQDIERGILARYDQERARSVIPTDRAWVSIPLSLGIANVSAFHAMSKQARATLNPKEVREDLSAKMTNALRQAWLTITNADERNRGIKRTKGATSTDPKARIGNAQVVKLLEHVKKVQEDGFEVPTDVQRAARTLVLWVTGQSAKTPKVPKAPKTTATEVAE